MTPANLKTTMAALAAIATPAHLRAAPSTTMSASPAPAPIAGAAPQRAAPCTVVSEVVDWDAIVAGQNARIGLSRPQAATPIASMEHEAPTTAQASPSSEGIDWSATVAAVNAENNCTHPGANPDPRLVAMLSGEVAR